MAEEKSSLREAVDRIMGAPAGGQTQSPQAVELAPRVPYSQDIGNAVSSGLQTVANIANTPFDPFAEQNAANAASLAAAKATNDQLAAQVAPSAVAAPAVAAPVSSVVSSAPLVPGGGDYQSKVNQYASGTYNDFVNKLAGSGSISPMAADWYRKYGSMAQKSAAGGGNIYTSMSPYVSIAGSLGANAKDQALKQDIFDWQRAMSAINLNQDIQAAGRTNWVGLGAPGSVRLAAPAPAATAPSRAPVQPGRNASWQASAQYWKDLDAYRKAGGT